MRVSLNRGDYDSEHPSRIELSWEAPSLSTSSLKLVLKAHQRGKQGGSGVKFKLSYLRPCLKNKQILMGMQILSKKT